MNDNYIYLDDSLTEKIKRKRQELGFTQNEISKIIKISRKAYGRIERNEVNKITKSLYRKISEALNLNVDEMNDEYNVRCTFYLSKEMKNDLEFFKNAKHFDSVSDTIKFCINEVMNDFLLEKISVELKEDIREAINNSFIHELEKLQSEKLKNEIILEYLSKMEVLDLKKLKSEIDEMNFKIKHAKY